MAPQVTAKAGNKGRIKSAEMDIRAASATPALRPRGRGGTFGYAGIRFRRNRQSDGREGELARRWVMVRGRRRSGKPPTPRAPQERAMISPCKRRSQKIPHSTGERGDLAVSY